MERTLIAAALTLSLVGCAPNHAALGAGAGAIVLGGIILANSGDSGRCDGSAGCILANEPATGQADEAMQGMGVAMLVGGVVLLAVGLATADRKKPGAESAQPQLVAARPVPPAHPSATPEMMARRSRVENRLAMQASLSARRGDCRAAVATSHRLAEVDPALYAELLRTDAPLAGCLDLPSTPAR